MNPTDDMSEHREPAGPSGWFDGWRIVTGVISLVFFGGSMFLLAAAESARQDAEECEATGDWFCGDFVPVMLIIMGVWALALGICFGSATLASDRGWRRTWTIAGMCLMIGPIVLVPAVAKPVVVLLFLAVVGLVLILARAGNRRAGSVPGNEDRGRE